MFELKIIVKITIIIIFLYSCEDNIINDNIPPTVTITYPHNGATVSELVNITCISLDNESIDKLELWVDGINTGIVDHTEPYNLKWNTTSYMDSSFHTITVRSYDNSGNKTDSDPVVLIVDNTDFYPSPCEISKIDFQNQSFIISWRSSSEIDFYSYTLVESQSIEMTESNKIYESTNRYDTLFTVNNINNHDTRYYQLIVTDIFGLTSSSLVKKGRTPYTIYFVNNDSIGGDTDIFRILEDGSQKQNISNDPADNFDPIISQDGIKIAYTLGNNETRVIVISNENGNTSNEITNFGSLPSLYGFSPDGNTVLFHRYYTNNNNTTFDIYTINIDGSGLVNLSDSPYLDYYPYLSPDGSKIAFWSNRNSIFNIYIMSNDGTNILNLTNFTQNNLSPQFSPEFSPDGNTIIYNLDGKIYLLEISDNSITYLADGFNPHFSKSGQNVVYYYYSGIYIIDIYSRNILQLYPSGTNPIFSPDDSVVLFTLETHLCLVNIDGTEFKILTDGWNPRFSPVQ